MPNLYRLVGSQDPTSRIDRWVVETATDDHPEKVLEVGGPPVELDQQQYEIGSRFLRLAPADDESVPDVQFVDQPGVQRESLSTDRPPDLGTAPDVNSLNKDDLVREVTRLQAEGELQDVDPKANKEELQKALRTHYGQEA